MPVVIGDVADLSGLREIGARLASEEPARSAHAAHAEEAGEPAPAGRP